LVDHNFEQENAMIKPKKTFIFSSEEARLILDAALQDRAELLNRSPSSIVEAMLERELLPSDPMIRRILQRVYLNDASVTSATRNIFSNYASYDWGGSVTHGLPLVEFTYQMCEQFGSVVTVDPKLKVNPIYHFRETLQVILQNLNLERTMYSDEFKSATLIAEIEFGKELTNQLADNSCSIEATVIIDFLLRNWDFFAGYTQTYRLLMGLLDLIVPWMDNPTIREQFKFALEEINRKDFLWQKSTQSVSHLKGDASNQFWKRQAAAKVEYQLASGKVTIPSDWRVLNSENWSDALYATVVEIRNSKGEWPHWVFFTADASDRFDTELIDSLILEDYPQYKKILSQVVQPPLGELGQMLPDDFEKWKSSLEPGYFDISLGGDKYADQNYINFVRESD